MNLKGLFMTVQIQNYTIKTEDKYNFGLYKSVPKGTFQGQGGKGNKDKVIGYYGSLSGALLKLVNNELLESNSTRDAKTLLEAISSLETLINNAFNIKPKETLCKIS